MADILIFHHAHGLTDGVRSFGDDLRRAGHTVHLPDMYEGQVFDTLEAGLDYANQVGFGAVSRRGMRAADALSRELVYAGFSLGVMPAQELAQTRPGARGALLLSACLPASEFGGWPDGVPVQIHGKDGDDFFAGESDIDAARALVDEADDAELFLYPGKEHLFADPGLQSYDPDATALLTER